MGANMLLILAASFAVVAAKSERIVGGEETTINEYPDMVAMLFTWDGSIFEHSCGGTIINTRSVLTAAHCLGVSFERYRIRVGSTFANSGGVVYTISYYINHPEYNVGAYMNADIAIVRTATAITLVPNTIQEAFYAGASYIVGDNSVVWATGWGLTAWNGPSTEILRHVQIWTINQAICAARYSNTGFTVNDNMLCSGWLDVGGRDQCFGDSGGPLYHNGVVVGVCSYGYECGHPYYPGINTRVSQFITWMQANA